MRRVFCTGSALLAVFMTAMPHMLAADLNVNVAPYGRRLSSENAVGIQWSEMRRILRVEVIFDGRSSHLPAANAMQVQYWHQNWDGAAIGGFAGEDAGRAGWARMDDWFNGKWKTADGRLNIEARTAIFTFASSEQKEFPDLKGSGVRYRPTLKIQVVFPGTPPKGAALRAFTDSTWQESEVAVRFENRNDCDDPLEVYNGKITHKRATSESDSCILRAKVTYAVNQEDPEADRTLVTLRTPNSSFTFAVDEVESGDRIYVKDFGALVTQASDTITIPEYRRILERSGTKSVYDRVTDHPEQTLSEAWKDMPLKRPYYFILGSEGGRQRFRLDPSGDLRVLHPSARDAPGSRRLPGADTARLLWPEEIYYRFGLPNGHFAERFPADGYLPIVTTRWLDGGLLYEEEAFANVLGGDLNTAPPMQADDPTVAFVKFRIANHSSKARTARLTLATSLVRPRRHQWDMPGPGEKFETLRIEDDRVLGSFKGKDVLRFLVDTRGAGRLTDSPKGIIYRLELAPHREHTLFLKIPFITLTGKREIDQLRSTSPEREREEVARYWRNRVAAGTQIHTPEPWLNDFYKAHLVHLLINNERELGSDRYAARVGSLHYGVFGNETIMMISDLDRRGYWKEAERSLELLLHYQGTAPLPGNYTSQRGVFYGAGNHEEGGYNQHHGWILWGLAEHYRHTRDRAWMKRAAPRLIEGCRWILEQRKGTMKRDAQGNPVPQYGLLPAGALEDVTDFWYWLSTNSFTWWGLENAAAALRDFGHPEAAMLTESAERYRKDILRAFREAMVRSPVVRLRDGTYIPHFPSSVYTRGRSRGWVRETLEGALMLIVTRLLDPNSREAGWILKDYEDNLYISKKYGYSIPAFERFWFSRGGFSMQPNLLPGPIPYFYRDEIKHFLRAYFNSFASAFDPTLRMLCEHPLPELGYIVGDHFKTSDEAQSTYWLRLMFVTELDGLLHLGRGIPRTWLKDGKTIGIRNASTHFGQLGYEIRSNIKDGRIQMSLDPPTRNAPREFLLRFRHPEGKKIQGVKVNGESWPDFDAVKGDIRLPGNLTDHTEIVAEYSVD